MRSLLRLVATPVVPAFLYLSFPETADAYLDPGTGSIIIQVVIGAAVGGLFAVKLFWSRIKGFFGNLFSRGEKRESAED